MGLPAAKQGDKIVATDTHIVLVPSPSGPLPIPLPHPFVGIIDGNLSPNVKIGGMPAATVSSTATNTPPHIPTPPGVSFQIPPTNKATIQLGSTTVTVNGKPLARNGDTALTCDDSSPLPAGKVIAVGTVLVG